MSDHIISGEKCLELLLDVSGDKIKKKPSSGSNKKETNQSITDLITSSSLKDYNRNKSEIKRLARLKTIGILKTNGGVGDFADYIVSLLRYSYQLSDDFINSIYSQ